MEWNIESARNNLSALVDSVLTNGPQTVRDGERSVVIIAEQEYALLLKREPSLIEALLDAPDLSDLNIERDQSPMREFDWD